MDVWIGSLESRKPSKQTAIRDDDMGEGREAKQTRFVILQAGLWGPWLRQARVWGLIWGDGWRSVTLTFCSQASELAPSKAEADHQQSGQQQVRGHLLPRTLRTLRFYHASLRHYLRPSYRSWRSLLATPLRYFGILFPLALLERAMMAVFVLLP